MEIVREPARAPSDARPSARYAAVRSFTEELASPLAVEDFVVQTMEDVSPTKWHLAHVTWFFETFVLRPHLPDYTPFHPRFAYLFNSYYVQAGERHCRDRRGYLSRPTVAEVYEYRAHVDRHMDALLNLDPGPEVISLVEVGIQHEQQHQELILTDIKHVFSVNPLRPAYHQGARDDAMPVDSVRWVAVDEGVYEIGHDGSEFAFDNEGPRHRVYLNAFQIADRLVTNREFIEFIHDGGYRRPELWLSLGWAAVQEKQWAEPFYWELHDGGWRTFTLSGMRDLDPDAPVTHVNYFEADAFARWAGARLPTEQEWEVAAIGQTIQGNLAETRRFHPARARPAPDGPLSQLYGDVWEWTRSPYSPYPGYQPAPGALGEYNGKFMCNQFVLRGGSCATSSSHLRATYRNFFPPDASWQFTGIRLARDVVRSLPPSDRP
jgi:ergothioneine biosynthesis protein EgtB